MKTMLYNISADINHEEEFYITNMIIPQIDKNYVFIEDTGY